MGFVEAINVCLKQKYADFNGRALRSEYWYFVLFTYILQLVLGVVASAAPSLGNAILGLVMLALIVPSLAVGARRLHDLNKSGWWQLLVFLPLIGIIVLIVFYCTEGNPGANRFGPAPVVAQAPHQDF